MDDHHISSNISDFTSSFYVRAPPDMRVENQSFNGTKWNMSFTKTAEYPFWEYKAAMLISQYYLWVIFALGFPGNVATIITFCRMQHLGSFSTYVVLLAVTDNLTISVKITFYQLLSRQTQLGTFGCGVLTYLGNFFATYCNWILVLMAIERLVAVRYPFKIIKFLSCMTKRRAAVVASVIAVVMAGMCLPILWISEYDEVTANCFLVDDVELSSVIKWNNWVFYALIPFVILAVCNILIAREIRVSFRLRNTFRSVRSSVTPRRSTTNHDAPVHRQIMLMLFTVTFMFVILNFPICALKIFESKWVTEEYTKPWAIKYLCFQLAYILCDSNHALNFYLYCVSARKFRHMFSDMFLSCYSKCSGKQVYKSSV